MNLAMVQYNIKSETASLAWMRAHPERYSKQEMATLELFLFHDTQKFGQILSQTLEGI